MDLPNETTVYKNSTGIIFDTGGSNLNVLLVRKTTKGPGEIAEEKSK